MHHVLLGPRMRMSRDVKATEDAVERALALVTEAMDLLDARGGPPDAAAHLSLAQERLRRAIRHSKRPHAS